MHQLLGTYRDAIPAYASTVTFSCVEEYLDVADQCLEAGYTAIKLHAWGDARADAELCQKLRAHVGDRVALMYDGSAGFDLTDAIYVGRSLSEAGYTWYEEPMREFSVTAYRRHAERVDVALLVAETSDGAHMNVADFITAGAAPTRCGPARSTRAASPARCGSRTLPTASSSAPKSTGSALVNAHLCMAIPNTSYYESLVYSNPVVREAAVGPDGERFDTRRGRHWIRVPPGIAAR